MNTTTKIDNSPMLGNILQERLKSELPHSDPLLVQCIVKDGALMVLVQHPAGVELDPELTFTVLEQAVIAEKPKILPQVKLYLRLEGENRPYAFHRFALQLPSEGLKQATADEQEYSFDKLVMSPTVGESIQDFGVAAKVIDAPVADIENSEALDTPFQYVEVPETETAVDSDIDAQIEVDDDHLYDDVEIDASASVLESEATEQSTSATNPWDEPVLESNSPSKDLPSKIYTPVESRWQPPSVPLPVVATVAGISLVFFASSLYMLTRPCVVGSCTAMDNAQKLRQNSTQILQYPSSGQEIIQAREQLKAAIGNLETIPVWSSHHNQAQDLLKNYQIEAARLDKVIMALSKAQKAAQKSQALPVTESGWMEVQKLWRETVQELEQVPKDSTLYKLAKQKQKVYKANLAIINKRLGAEQQASKNLAISKDTARIAEAKSNVADSLETWQLVNNSWKIAVRKLQEIPSGTTAYPEAQQLLKEYQSKLADARDRQTQEQFAANAYRQSISLAQQAKKSQAENQWTKAVTNWRNSLTYAKQVPNSSFYYNKTLLLINTYTDSLRQAETQLRVASVNQQARKDLNQTCAGLPQACTYTITNNVIKVKITPAYMQSVQQTAIAAKMRGDYTAQTMVYNHVVTLSEALKVISNNVHTRLEIYTPDGVLRETHLPGV